MRANKSNAMRAVNDVLLYHDDEQYFVKRLYDNVYGGIIALRDNMSSTMRTYLLDVANAITTIVIYRLYKICGAVNEHCAMRFIKQRKVLVVLCDMLVACLSIHDLPNEIYEKIQIAGKPLFNFINKNY